MAVKTEHIKDILKSDMENKKSFTAKWDTDCALGGEDIFEGDTFYFMGEKQKICQSCFIEITTYLEE